MPEIRPLSPGDFSLVYETFLVGDDPYFSRDKYEPMFAARPDSHGPYGYGLFADGRLAGMLGTIVSRRVVRGREEKFCNLHSWFVEPEQRGYSLLLMRAVLKNADWTLTDFTATPEVFTLSRRLGFQPLDGRLTLLFRPWRRKRRPESVELLADRQQIVARCRVEDETVLAAVHDPFLTPLLVVDGEGECLVLARKVDRHCRPHCAVHHLSDPTIFARWSVPVRNALLDLCGGAFVAVDRRRLGDHRLPFRLTLPVSSRQLYRSSRVDPAAIDTLRTELPYLGLTTLPEKRLYLAAVAAKLRSLQSRLDNRKIESHARGSA